MQDYFIYNTGAYRIRPNYVLFHSCLLTSSVNTVYFTGRIFFFVNFYQFNAYYFTNDLKVAHNDFTFENIHGLINRSPRVGVFEHDLAHTLMI